MLNKALFKQTILINYKLWIIFTAGLSFILALITAFHEQTTVNGMLDTLENTGLYDLMGENLSIMTSLNGVLSQTYYGLIAVILPLAYVIILSNNLVVNEVDKGSMAYILSTPVKRISVIFTKAVFLVSSLFLMFLIITLTGIISIQGVHKCIWGVKYSEDTAAVSRLLDVKKSEINDNVNLILNNDSAIECGANARELDKEAYITYLELKQDTELYSIAADIMGIDVKIIEEDVIVILSNEQAVKACMDYMNFNRNELENFLYKKKLNKEINNDMEDFYENKFIDGIKAAADYLKTDFSALSNNLMLLKNDETAMSTAISKSGISDNMFNSILNLQIAKNELNKDKKIEFSLKTFILLNLTCFLLIFALSSVSFLSSCFFNLTRYSLAFGAGIPLAFLILQIVSLLGDNFEKLKYFTMCSLFHGKEIASGTYRILPVIALFLIGTVFYSIGMYIFKKKDLPL